MMEVPPRRPQHSSLNIINKIQKDSLFNRNDFCNEMGKIGHKSPQAYLWRYEKSGLIKRVARGRYKIIY